jgi:uncharacterized membrane protein
LRTIALAALLIIGDLATATARAPEGVSLLAQAPDTGLTPMAPDTLRRGAGLPPGARRPPYKLPSLLEALVDHPHNKLVHFPIVLTLTAATFLLIGRKRPELEPLGFWLVWAAALSVIAAYFSGQAQEEGFHGKPKEWLVELHEKQGIAIGVGQALWVLSLLKASTRRYSWVLGIVLAVMVLAAALLGGLVAHGH